jgi:predicted ribosome quality control (RQC) complex YloA/Tae2 family protein
MIFETFCFNDDTYIILIGKNKNENNDLIDGADKDDMWFHVQDIPSCHVLLKHHINVKKYPQQVIKRCAYLCKIHSNAKTLQKCNIIYTTVSNITKTNHIGEVIAEKLKIMQV